MTSSPILTQTENDRAQALNTIIKSGKTHGVPFRSLYDGLAQSICMRRVGKYDPERTNLTLLQMRETDLSKCGDMVAWFSELSARIMQPIESGPVSKFIPKDLTEEQIKLSAQLADSLGIHHNTFMRVLIELRDDSQTKWPNEETQQ